MEKSPRSAPTLGAAADFSARGDRAPGSTSSGRGGCGDGGGESDVGFATNDLLAQYLGEWDEILVAALVFISLRLRVELVREFPERRGGSKSVIRHDRLQERGRNRYGPREKAL